MSRREYKINESNLPNGCIFYAPLTENTIDLISGINGETINANVNYDTNEVVIFYRVIIQIHIQSLYYII